MAIKKVVRQIYKSMYLYKIYIMYMLLYRKSIYTVIDW